MHKIAVFGASGRTGRLFTELALKNGYEVKALVRQPSRLSLQQPNLEVIQGDICDPAKVDETIQTTEAVIDLIAPKKDSPTDLRKVETKKYSPCHGLFRRLRPTTVGPWVVPVFGI